MITTETIQNDIETYSRFKISRRDRTLHVTLLRFIYYTLSRDFTEDTLKDIAIMRDYGELIKRNHASVINGIRKWERDKVTYHMHNDLYVVLRDYYKKNDKPYYEEEKVVRTHKREMY